MVEYSADMTGLAAADLAGFFEGWANQPSQEDLLRVLRSSYRAVIARAEGGRVVGFITAISDGEMNAHIPLLEVLPDYRGRGIGSKLVSMMLQELEDMYGVDLTCDEALVGFYERLGLQRVAAMASRRPEVIGREGMGGQGQQ